MSDDAIHFRKMNGLGNDFVVLDARERAIAMDEATVRRIADRNTGVGCDQLIMMEPSSRADVKMRIWNNAGGEVESCGNASRCIADLLINELGKETVTINTQGGLLICYRTEQGDITVDMGVPRFEWQDIPLAEEFHDTRGIELQIGPIDNPVLHTPSVVNVGNPHCVFWVDDVASHDLGRFGPLLENHPIFPDRANISLAQIVDRGHMILKVWERGAGLTRACGTGACAAHVCAVRKTFVDRTSIVTLPGGDLTIEWRERDDHILMTGPVSYDYEGELSAPVAGGAV